VERDVVITYRKKLAFEAKKIVRQEIETSQFKWANLTK
jgi:hypothetical protein